MLVDIISTKMEANTQRSRNNSADQHQLDKLKDEIAKANDFDLYLQYSENQAAQILGFKSATLKRRRLTGQIAYVRKGPHKVTYFGFQIAEIFCWYYKISFLQHNYFINDLVQFGKFRMERLSVHHPAYSRLHALDNMIKL